ncbi:MAG TPA: oxygenase MpaB family protein [Mycobacteriales bacterium]
MTVSPTGHATGGAGAVPDEIFLSGLGGGMAGTANVIMQLAWPAIGYGVVESKVDSGAVMKHPVKRARTTFTFLAVALLGNDDDRQAYREAVNTSHRLVRSGPDSPVRYNAFDPDLQLWVAACLYWGTVDIIERMYGPLDDDAADRLYQHCAYFGTTLQVPREMWPPDRHAFAAYWEEGLAKVSIDDTVRAYLRGLADLVFLPRPLQLAFGPFNRFVTAGFLPPLFREQMGFAWSESDQRRFDLLLRVAGRIDRLTPRLVAEFPFNALLADMRRRRRRGRPLV